MIRYAASPQVQQLLAALEAWAQSGSSTIRLPDTPPPGRQYGAADLGFYNTLHAIKLNFIYWQIQHASDLLRGAYQGLWQDSWDGTPAWDMSTGMSYFVPPAPVAAGTPGAFPVAGWDYGSGPSPDYVAQLHQFYADQAAAAAAAAAWAAANPQPVFDYSVGGGGGGGNGA